MNGNQRDSRTVVRRSCSLTHNHPRNDTTKKNDTTIETTIRKLKQENDWMKKSLCRRFSGKSQASATTDEEVAPVKGLLKGNCTDDSMYLLRETSTLHGLRDVMLSSSDRLRVVWTCIVVTALMMTLQGCYQIMDEYRTRRIVVSYFIQEAEDIKLPDVVVCPYNRFNRSYFEHNNVSFELAQFLELSFPSVELPFENLLLKRDEIIRKIDTLDFQLEEILTAKNMTYVDFLKNASLNCTAFFQDASRCNNITEMMTSAGKCFRLEGTRQEASGFGNGDRYIIDLPEEFYNPGINQMINSGVIIKLAERGKGIDNDLTFLPAGVHAIMPLLGTQFEFMNDPPRYECQEDYFKNYSRVHCYEGCLTSEAQTECKCSPAAAHNPEHPDSICTATLLYHCFFPKLFTQEGQLPKEKVDACKKKCKAPCRSWSYNKQVSYSTIPSEASRRLISKEEFEKMRRRVILDIYYSQLDYTIIKHVVAMPLSSLVAQIGGQFSLWAGGSLISLCQIIIYCSRFILHKWFGLRSTPTDNDMQTQVQAPDARSDSAPPPANRTTAIHSNGNGNGHGALVNIEMASLPKPKEEVSPI